MTEVIQYGETSSWRQAMKIGDQGADVAAWQSVLIDVLKAALTDEAGVFGHSTHNYTMSFQFQANVTIDGVVGAVTRSHAKRKAPGGTPVSSLPSIYDFIEARNWSRHLAPRDAVDWIVIHCMEGPETSTRAERCAARFASDAAPKASCHYCVDCDTVVQCVHEDRVAWHAPGANKRGIGIEHAGFARQSEGQWLDEYGRAMLWISADLCAGISSRWNVPIKFVDRDGLKRGERGITTHCEVTHAFKKSTHTDPGPYFPMSYYLSLVRRHLEVQLAE